MCLAILQQHNESRRCGVNGLHDKHAARLRRSTCYAAVRRSAPQRAASSAWSVTPETTTDDRAAQPMNQSRSPASPVHHRHDRFHCQTEPINCRRNSPRFTHFVYLVGGTHQSSRREIPWDCRDQTNSLTHMPPSAARDVVQYPQCSSQHRLSPVQR